MQPTPAPSPPSTSAGILSSPVSSSSKPVLYLATQIHPVSRVLADSLFDVIDQNDERYETWFDYADAAVLRIGRITAEEARKAKKLKIIARNGCAGSPLALHCPCPFPLPLHRVEEPFLPFLSLFPVFFFILTRFLLLSAVLATRWFPSKRARSSVSWQRTSLARTTRRCVFSLFFCRLSVLL
jgi:hypothetical protein